MLGNCAQRNLEYSFLPIPNSERSIMQQEQKYQLSTGVLYVETNGESVLMDYGSGKYFGLRGAAQVLLEPLRNGVTRPQMIDFVSTHYQIGREEAAADLDKLLPKLLDAGIVAPMETV
jgi:hypothetical protein